MYNTEKSGATSCHTAFHIYKYRLYGNINVFTLQGQGEPSILWFLLCMRSP